MKLYEKYLYPIKEIHMVWEFIWCENNLVTCIELYDLHRLCISSVTDINT